MKNIKPLYFVWGIILLIIPIISFKPLTVSGYGVALAFTFVFCLLSFFNILFAFNKINTNYAFPSSQVFIAISVFSSLLASGFSWLLDVTLEHWFFPYEATIIFLFSPVFFIIGVIVMFSSILKRE